MAIGRRGVCNRLLRWVLRLLAGVVVLVGLALVLLVVFEQRWGRFVVQKSIEALNAQLAVPVSTSDISFTFFRNFPHASLHLRNVFVPSTLPRAGGHSDTLLLAESVYLVFNPFSLARGRYRIERCQIVHGYLYLRQDAQGTPNYALFRPQEGDTAASAASLALNRLLLSQIAVVYRDERSQLHASALLGELSAAGAFSHQQAELQVRGEGLVEILQQGEFVYAKRQRFTLRSRLLHQGAQLSTTGTELSLDRNRFHLVGQVDTGTGQIELTATGRELDLRSVLGFASQFQWQPPANVDVRGQLNATLSLSGNVRRGQKLHVQMGLRGDNLSLRLGGATYTIPRLLGSFSNGEAASPTTTSLELTDCQIVHRESSLSLVFSMKNLVKPIFYAKFNANLQGSEMVPPSMRSYLRGYKSISASGELLSQLRGLDTLSLGSLVSPRLNLQCSFTDLCVAPSDSVELTHLDGSITVIENDLAKSAISGQWGEVTFSAGASVRNALALLTGQGLASWTVSASLAGADLHRVASLASGADTAQAGAGANPGFWARTSSIMGNLTLSDCRYAALPLQRMETQFTLLPREAQVQIADAALLGGQLSGRVVHRDAGSGRTVTHGTLQLSRLNLKELLRGVNDFGQTALTSHNIDGLLSGSVTFHVPRDSGRVNATDLQAQAAVSVEQGALTDMRGLEQLASFIDLEELRHIRFSTLSNTITLRHQRVAIPKMHINSSALNLALSGEHRFTSAYQYRIALRLSDLLFHRLKGKRRDLEDNALADPAHEGAHSLFLILEGDSTRTSVRFDHAAFKERMQQKIQQERETLERMLQEEFGANPPAGEPHRPPAYTIEWDEAQDTAATRPRREEPRAPSKPPVRITWEDSRDAEAR